MTTVDDQHWGTFCFDAKEDKFDYIQQAVEKNCEKYVISFETRDKKGNFKPHFHILTFMGRKAKNALVRKVVDDLDLREKKGTHGGKRKYANLDKNIPQDELNLFIQYLMKEHNVRYKNIDHELISDLSAKAYIKTQQSQYREKLFQYLEGLTTIFPNCKQDQWHDQSPIIYNRIKGHIITYCIDNDHQLTHNLKSQIINYLRTTQQIDKNAKTQLLISLIN